MKKKRDSSAYYLTKKDVRKWLLNALIFAAPVVITQLMALQGRVSQDASTSMWGLFLINVVIDLLRKFISDTKSAS